MSIGTGEVVIETVEQVIVFEESDGSTSEVVMVEEEMAILEFAEQGPPGTGDRNFVHTQMIPSATWTVLHGLGKRCSITIVDSAGSVVFGDIVYDSDNQITVSFTAAFGGKAYCN